jgi:hypothetical protein
MINRSSAKLFFLLGFLGLIFGLEILTPEDLTNTKFMAPRLRWIGPVEWEFDLIGQLVSINSSDVTNKIVLSRHYQNEEIEDLFRNRNALGAVVFSGNSPADIPGISNYVLDTPQREVLLPTVTISVFTFEQLRTWIEDEGRNITIRLTSSDRSPWDDMMQSGVLIFYGVFMSAFTLTCIGLAAYKLAMFVQVKGCHESIPQTMLIFEIVANTIRFFASVVDPLQSRVVLPYTVSQMFFTTSWPFVIGNLLLISFYWHELMTKTSMRVNRFLSKLRIPFWCIFAVILAMELAASLLRGLGYDLKIFLIVMGVGYIIIGLACVIFYIYTGRKLTRMMEKASKELIASNRVKRLNRTSRYIYASAGGVIVWLIAIAIGGLTIVFWLPWGYFGVWFAGFFSITFISLMQILAIHEPGSICAKYGKSTDMSQTKSNTSLNLSNTVPNSPINSSRVDLLENQQ